MLLETGYENTTLTGSGAAEVPSYPQAYLRLGTGDPHLELDLTAPSHTNDGTLGAKYELGYTSKAVWGANVQASLPTASRAFTAGGAQYTGNFNWGYTLNAEFSLAGTFGFDSLTGYDASGIVRRYFAFVPSLEATAALPGNAQFFAEYAYFTQAGIGLSSRSLVDFGLQKDLGPHWQVDVEYGTQPTLLNGQRAHYVGAGLAFMN